MSKCVDVQSIEVCVKSKMCHLVGESVHLGEWWAKRTGCRAGCRRQWLADTNQEATGNHWWLSNRLRTELEKHFMVVSLKVVLGWGKGHSGESLRLGAGQQLGPGQLEGRGAGGWRPWFGPRVRLVGHMASEGWAISGPLILKFNNWENGESIRKLRPGRGSDLSKFVT